MKLRQIQPDYYILENKDLEIIASSSISDKFKYKLSKQNCDYLFGVIDVCVLANQHIIDGNNNDQFCDFESFVEGFDTAIQLNEHKVFTIQDMEDAIIKALNVGLTMHTKDTVELHKDKILSSFKHKEIDVELTMKPRGTSEFWTEFYKEKNKGLCDNPDEFKYNILELDKNDCLILTKIL